MYKTLQEMLSEGHLENMLAAEIADQAEATSEQDSEDDNSDVD